MKRIFKILIGIVIIAFIAYLFAPPYVKNALRYGHANITDWEIFYNDTVNRADSVWDWKEGVNYNKQQLSKEDREYIEKYETVAFLVIQNDTVLFEEYWDDWRPDSYSNIFSATKSIVSLLMGIAIDEGYIDSVNVSIGKFLPEYNKAPENKITIKDLLTMSSGLSWDESYSTLFSVTTQGYYGEHLRKVTMNLHSIAEPGKQYTYRSGDTQLLSFIIEKATGKTISAYASEKLWKPMQAKVPALWSTDTKDGDEKAFCCFNTNARDIARVGRLILNQGNWNGMQLVPGCYMKEATTAASYLENEFGTGPLDYYGYQIWLINHNGEDIPYMRGHLGQYIYAIPSKNAIVVRLGQKKDEREDGPNTMDIKNYLDIADKFLK